MKKILSLILALAMALTLAVPAFAETTGSSNTSGTASGSSNISGSVNNTTAAYVMVIPAGNTNLDMKSTTAQSIGNLKITRTATDKNAGTAFNTEKKVSVAITSTNSGNLKITTEGKNDTLAYTLGIGSTNVTSWTTAPVQDFAASAIDAETAVAMTAKITGDSTTVANGTYKDTLTFNASVKDAVTPVTLTNAGGNLLSSDNLGTPSDEFTVSSGSVTGTFVAYNSFISTSSKSSWQNAKDFVAKLNNANYDGHSDWCLLGSEAMANAWYTNFSSVARGLVHCLWSSVEDDDNDAYYLDCGIGDWDMDEKSLSNDYYGFVVLRPADN